MNTTYSNATSEIPPAVRSLFDSVERQNFSNLRAVFTKGGIIWHNYDGMGLSVDDMIAHLEHSLPSIRYTECRAWLIQNIAFIQSVAVFTRVLKNEPDKEFRLNTLMRVELTSDGLIARLEEYFDTSWLAKHFEL